MNRNWNIVYAVTIAVLLTGVLIAAAKGGVDGFVVLARVLQCLFLFWFALFPVVLLKLLLTDRVGSRLCHYRSFWIAVVFFIPSAWAVTDGIVSWRRRHREASQLAAARQSFHDRISAAEDVTAIAEPLSGPAQDEVISFIQSHPMSSEAQIAAAAHFGHLPRVLDVLVREGDVPDEALSIIYDSSLTLPGAREAPDSLGEFCIRGAIERQLCTLWEDLAERAPPELLQKMLNAPNPVLRSSAALAR